MHSNHCLSCPAEAASGETISADRTESRTARPEVVCPICRSPRVRKIYDGVDSVVSRFQNDGPCRLSLHRCRDCGMTFIGRVNYPPEAVHEAYWRMLLSSRLSSYSVDEGIQLLDLDRLIGYRRLNRLLEVGCGEGFILSCLRKRGWQVFGTDISPEAVKLAKSKHGLDVILSPLNDDLIRRLGPASFDVVIMWGLLEHLPDPAAAVCLSRRLLREGGVLIVYTPNAASIFHRLAWLSYRATGGKMKSLMERVIVAMHLMYFTPRTIRQILEDAGYRIRMIKPVDIDLDLIFNAHDSFWWSNRPFYLLARFLQRLSGLAGMNSHLLVVAEAASFQAMRFGGRSGLLGNIDFFPGNNQHVAEGEWEGKSD